MKKTAIMLVFFVLVGLSTTTKLRMLIVIVYQSSDYIFIYFGLYITFSDAEGRNDRLYPSKHEINRVITTIDSYCFQHALKLLMIV